MPLFENMQLRDKHTFHLEATTQYWADYESVDELRNLLQDNRFDNISKFSIGGGSNLLFTKDFRGLLLHSAIKTIEPTEQNNHVSLRVGSGVAWDDLVAYTVDHDWSGLENLSGIPGDVGASPVQNIGAYGSEAKDCIELVEALNLETLEYVTLTNADCRFGYRDSVFKKELKNKFIVCYVTYLLSKDFTPNLKYGGLNDRMEAAGGINLKNLRKAVLEIRGSKLPDPNLIGNAGSFFMNPEITVHQFESLKARYPEVPSWPLESGLVKISAAWCIDKAGWKGKALGNAAVHDKQALVLVNPGNAVAADILNLSKHIISDVESQFGITLHPEVIFI
ncbi:MAG TPA: UDP-N-acetylmuramate dehydrogenase [Bacteroidales bacterium]|nr:UDP-N-acetylmuramate dehydrogenase [Bacteroidales bacterium]